MNDPRWALGTHESWGALLPGCKLVLCRRGGALGEPGFLRQGRRRRCRRQCSAAGRGL